MEAEFKHASGILEMITHIIAPRPGLSLMDHRLNREISEEGK